MQADNGLAPGPLFLPVIGVASPPMKTFLLIAVLLLTVIVATAGNYPQQKTWEYKLEYKISEKRANELALQGWELVAAGTDNAGSMNIGFLVFKRSLR